ncbi:cation-transporting P-type ATPase [Phycicoccus endophyticus]|uniref:Cation-transporting P-type ATPase n=1 Tax=Phycicoccus endophyticus TaxID=1690220 RepID=A0A7G9R6B0_9MICO|nr:cation-transporting P-type ATPase [Phycicoccus endophyticus]QNN51135.1 cation-transporting P-type ATPase [Phycicoccus endophyticus]GGL37461.1 ATPase [Phycicoccus endophyticus]
MSQAHGSTAWHTLPAEVVAERVGADAVHGLSAEEAAARLARSGPNVLPEGGGRRLRDLVLEQLRDVMILLLLAAAVVSGLLGDVVDTVAIVVILVLNGVIGVVQGYRAERALEALRALAAPRAAVVRDGRPLDVDSAEVVVGDLVLLEAGTVVAADLRLVDGAALQVAEAALTGESVPVSKSVRPVEDATAHVGDRTCMVHRGTEVTAGRGAGVVVATGTDTEIGRVAQLMTSTDEVRTPLQRRLSHLSSRLAVAVVVISAVVFVSGLLRGEDPLQMLLTAVSLAVAAVPEALPAVVTISLALGASAMVRQQALVRRLPAVETLGSVTYICSDKTGTLTRNRMSVEETWTPGGDLPGLSRALVACNDAVLLDGEASGGRGDPTELALLHYAAEGAGGGPDVAPVPRRAEIPFDAERRRMLTVHDAAVGEPGGYVAYAKGAPEVLLPRCAADPATRARAEERARRMAGDGLRVLAVARRGLDRLPEDLADVEDGMTLLGLVGLLDPPREEAAAAVAECRAAGIVPVMITGDHPDTAHAVAARVGVAEADHDATDVLTGRELAALDDAGLASRVLDARVYARVDPEQKIRIVRALQADGQVAAMTGDGVNDAPALRQADIGVAMGAGGTDVARGASAMVLLDDNFATIVSAVREGRRIYDNIRRFVKYTLTSNAGEIWVMFLGPLLGLPLPLLPLQILWINLVTDGLPGLALAREPAEPTVMRRPPRPPGESIFAHGVVWHIGWVGLLIGGVSLGGMAWAYLAGEDNWQTVVFTVLVLAQLGHSLAVRSETQPSFGRRFATNPALLGAVVLTVGLQLAVVYLPWLQGVFRTDALSAAQLAVCVALALVVPAAVEVEKTLVRRGLLYARPAAPVA